MDCPRIIGICFQRYLAIEFQGIDIQCSIIYRQFGQFISSLIDCHRHMFRNKDDSIFVGLYLCFFSAFSYQDGRLGTFDFKHKFEDLGRRSLHPFTGNFIECVNTRWNSYIIHFGSQYTQHNGIVSRYSFTNYTHHSHRIRFDTFTRSRPDFIFKQAIIGFIGKRIDSLYQRFMVLRINFSQNLHRTLFQFSFVLLRSQLVTTCFVVVFPATE